MNIASEIRAEMGRDQISATELAKKAGISFSSMRRKVLDESRAINTDELSKIARALGVPTWELVRRAEEAGNQATLKKGGDK